MALDFSVLQGMDPAGAFFRGQEAVRAEQDRNMLRQAQMEQMVAQRENMLAQREDRRLVAAERQAKMDRAAQRQTFLGGLSAEMAKGGYKLDRPTLGKMLDFGMSSGEDSLIKLATEGLRALDEDEREQSELARLGMGGAPAAAAPATLPGAAPAAPPNLLAGTPYDIGPVNALAAPAPAAAPAGVTREQVQQMLQSPSARVRERGKALAQTLPKEVEPTAGMREYQEAVRQGFKGTFMEYKQSLVPKPPQLSVKLPEQEKAFETGLGKAQAERIMEDQKVAQDARGIIDTVQQGRQLLQSGTITGFGAEALTQIGAALNQIGINFAEDAVANTQAFAANMAQNVGRIIKQFGAGTGLSNADREYAEKMAGGKITLDRKAIERILDINERAARNVIGAHNRRVQGIKTNVPLTVEMPPGPPAAAPIPSAPAAAATDVSAERANAGAAIAAGAPEAAVRKRFKDKTGQEF
jgi:hypothetical protein